VYCSAAFVEKPCVVPVDNATGCRNYVAGRCTVRSGQREYNPGPTRRPGDVRGCDQVDAGVRQ